MAKKYKRNNKSQFTNKQEHFLYTLASSFARSSMQARLGKSYDDDRDLYESLGYPTKLDFNHFYAMYDRQGIAKRIITAPVSASWLRKPNVYDSEEDSQFRKDWENLVNDKLIYHYLARVDKISGIGQYGCLFYGFDDQNEINKEVMGSKLSLMYLQPFKENNVELKNFIDDTKNENFGYPEIYGLKFSAVMGKASSAKTMDVHFTRCLHVAEGIDESEIYGTPRLREIYNRLLDLDKIVGGSGEMFWRAGLPPTIFKADDDAQFADDAQTKAQLEDEIQMLVHGLKRWMKVQGMSVEQLESKTISPRDYYDIVIEAIAGSKAIPKRILVGSERGELASSQDESNWNTRIDERRKDYCEPMILRPFIDDMIKYGVIAQPKEEQYTIEWPDLFGLSIMERMDVADKMMSALQKYASSPDAQFILPVEKFYETVLEWEEDKIEEVMKLINQGILEEGQMRLDEALAENDQLRAEIELLKSQGQYAEAGEE